MGWNEAAPQKMSGTDGSGWGSCDTCPSKDAEITRLKAEVERLVEDLSDTTADVGKAELDILAERDTVKADADHLRELIGRMAKAVANLLPYAICHTPKDDYERWRALLEEARKEKICQ